MKKPPDLPSPPRLPISLVSAPSPDLQSSSRNLRVFSVGGSPPSPITSSSHPRYGMVWTHLGYCSSSWLRSGVLGTVYRLSPATVPLTTPSNQRYAFEMSCQWSSVSVWAPSAIPGSLSVAIPCPVPLLYAVTIRAIWSVDVLSFCSEQPTYSALLSFTYGLCDCCPCSCYVCALPPHCCLNDLFKSESPLLDHCGSQYHSYSRKVLRFFQ